MSVDHTKLVYYSGYNAYKNVDVKTATISVTGGTIGPSTSVFFSTTVDVEPDTKYAYVLMQANDLDGSLVPQALEWRQFPANCIVRTTLTLDPDLLGFFELFPQMVVNSSGTQVTFRLFAINTSASNIALTPIDVGVQYATFTVE